MLILSLPGVVPSISLNVEYQVRSNHPYSDSAHSRDHMCRPVCMYSWHMTCRVCMCVHTYVCTVHNTSKKTGNKKCGPQIHQHAAFVSRNVLDPDSEICVRAYLNPPFLEPKQSPPFDKPKKRIITYQINHCFVIRNQGEWFNVRI